MKLKKLVIIIAQGRSGTTLLNKILSSNKDIFFLNNEFTDLPFFYFNQSMYNKYGSKKYVFMARDFFKHPEISYTQDKNLENLENIKTFREFLDKIFDSYPESKNRPLIGIKIADKIPENVKMIKSCLRESYIIHLIRDPRDVFLSLKKVNFPVISPFYAAKSWNESINAIFGLKNNVKKYHETRYEKLVSNPEDEIRRICSFLGITFEKGMLDFYKNVGEVENIHKNLKRGIIKDNFNKWKGQLNKRQLNLIYAAAHKNMFRLGYTDKDDKITISFIRRLINFVIDKSYYYYRLFKIGKIRRIKETYLIKLNSLRK